MSNTFARRFFARLVRKLSPETLAERDKTARLLALTEKVRQESTIQLALLRALTTRVADQHRAVSARLEAIDRKVSAIRPFKAVYLGRDEVLAETHAGIRIFVDGRDTGIAPHLIWNGRWEPWIEPLVIDRLRPGDQVCDIGANFGYFTLAMAERVGPTGKVYAFEANPALHRLLVKSLSINGFDAIVQLWNLAVSDRDDEAVFSVDRDFSGGGSIVQGDHGEGFRVPTRRIDDLVPADAPVALIKMDVEGAEALVVAGGRRLFATPTLHTVVMEYGAGSIADVEPPEIFLDRFVADGFALSLVRPDQAPEPMTAAGLVAAAGDDLVYVLAERERPA